MNLLSKFGRKDPLPPPAAKKAPVAAQKKPAAQSGVRAAPAEPAAKPAESHFSQVGDPGVVSSFDKVPTHQSVLTLGAQAAFRVPKDLEKALMALECGPQRAIILYDPEADIGKIRQAMTTLRAQMLGQSYKFDRNEVAAKSNVLLQLYQDTIRRSGSDGSDRNQDQSTARRNFERWVELAVRERATDIHIEVESSSRALVRIRVDGELEPMRDENNGQYPSTLALDAMSYAFNIGAGRGTNNQSNFERSQNLYCMIAPRPIANKQIALRYQSIRGAQGPKLVCRLLNVDVNAPTLTYEQLGYAESQMMLWREAAKMSAGFIIIAGVTGSGKTTTLKTFIETHPGSGSCSFYSIEDPVEYPLKSVHQIPLQRDLMDKAGSAAKFNEVVGALMRGDPDGVLVGEIRDNATAMAGQQIVETGHMAAGTVHAHLLSGILPRLTNDEVGMSREVLTNPNMLSLLAYQALAPVLCPHCAIGKHEAISAASTQAEVDHIQSLCDDVDGRFGLDSGRLRFKRIGGCAECNGRGTKGLTVVAEMMIPDRTWLSLSREGKDYEAVMHYRSFSDRNFLSSDMTGKTVFEHALFKAMNQQLDPRQCERFDSFSRFEILGVQA